MVRADDDQLPGACRNWMTSEMLAAMWDGQAGVALFMPDAPTVQFGTSISAGRSMRCPAEEPGATRLAG